MANDYINIEESTTPYTIRSCFRTSDENPFSGQQEPEIQITFNGADGTTIQSHKVLCEATYSQVNFIQWKTYQWVLSSEDGSEIYLKSEVGYDNEIKHTFYGLKNGHKYLVTLLLETNDNRTITINRTIQCSVQESEGATESWLLIEKDCNGYYSGSSNGDDGEACVTIRILLGGSYDIYKCEIWPQGEEPIYHPVKLGLASPEDTIKDFLVANNRWYKYLVVNSVNENVNSIGVLHTSWGGWSITEMRAVDSVDNSLYEYVASAVDVWKFKYNISAGATTHNLNKTPYSTLGRFPYFSVGSSNYVSGSVTCLLGREIIPVDLQPTSSRCVFNESTGQWEWTPAVSAGGYQEILPNGQQGFRDLTSNEKINMLLKWQDFCASGNPKLLKDEKGNQYIVQILNTSSETQYNLYGRPEQISFEWQQIADTQNKTVYRSAASPAKISHYTVEWNPNTDTFTRLDDAAPITTDTKNFVYSGKVNLSYSNSFDFIYPWSERKLCNVDLEAYGALGPGDPLETCITAKEGEAGFSYEDENGVWVYTPEFWGKSYIQSGKYYFEVLSGAEDGATYYPEKLEGRWHGCIVPDRGIMEDESWLLPRSGVARATRQTLSHVHDAAKQYGATLDNIYTLSGNLLLMIVEFASLDSQTKIGKGAVDSSGVEATEVKGVLEQYIYLSQGASSWCKAGVAFNVIRSSETIETYAVESAVNDIWNEEPAWKVKVATLDSESSIDVTAGDSIVPNGRANTKDEILGSKSGYIGTNGQSIAYYRGVEMWGNSYFYILGAYRKKTNRLVCLANSPQIADDYDSLPEDASEYTEPNILLSQTGGWIENIVLDYTNTGLSLNVLPICTSVRNVSTAPTFDYIFTDNSKDVVLLSGGYYGAGTQAGAFGQCWRSEGSTLWDSSVVSARPCLLPKSES